VSTSAPPGGASAPSNADTSGDEMRRPRRASALVAAAFMLVGLGTVGVLYDGTLVWLNRLEHPFLFGCVAAGAFGVGVCQLLPTGWLRVLVAVACIAVAGAWGLLGIFVVSVFGMSILPVAAADAPGDREYKAVVHEQPDWIDTVWYVSIRQTRGPLSREWPAGCISNDPTADPSIEHVTWQSPRRLLVTTRNAGITIFVDPRTGKPESPIPSTAKVAC